MESYKRQDKAILDTDSIDFNRPGPIQASRGQNTAENIDARFQMDKFSPEEISQKAANIMSMHVAQSPQTQQLVEVLNLVLKKGQLFEQLAVKYNGQIDINYINSIEEPSDFAKTLAKKNIPMIQTTGELLEYLVAVKKNEEASIDDIDRTSNTKWESVFVGPNEIEHLYNVNHTIREFQYERLVNSFGQIFNSMCKFLDSHLNVKKVVDFILGKIYTSTTLAS